MVFVQVLLVHATVLGVAQYLIVSHVLTLMVCADIQHVVVILAATHMIMGLDVLPVKLVAMAPVVYMSLLDPLASIALNYTIAAMGRVIARPRWSRRPACIIDLSTIASTRAAAALIAWVLTPIRHARPGIQAAQRQIPTTTTTASAKDTFISPIISSVTIS